VIVRDRPRGLQLLYLLRGSVTPSWMAHAMNNTWAYVLLAPLR